MDFRKRVSQSKLDLMAMLKEIRSKKLPDNRKYETTPKGVKKNMNNLKD